jgi:DNA-binding NtrC family response regulator
MTEKKVIGIIDDHVQSAISLSQILENNGFKTFQAYNCSDAVKAIKEKNPDIVIVDFSSIENSEKCGLSVNLPKKKILFILNDHEEDRKKIKKYKNVIGIVEKPIDIEEVLKILRKELRI